MRCADFRSRAASVFRLIRSGGVIVVVSNREGVYLAGLALGEQGRIRTGVDSTGKEDAYRNVGHLPQPNRGSELGHQALDQLILGNADKRSRVIPYVPISMCQNAPVRADPQPRPGPKFVDSPVQGLRRRSC